MKDLVLVIDILSAVGLVGLILLQQGKGADIGAAFGSGASQTLFGSRGTSNFLTRMTAILAIVFFVSNLGLAWYTHQAPTTSVTKSVTQEQPAKPEMPAVPVAPAPAKVPEVPK